MSVGPKLIDPIEIALNHRTIRQLSDYGVKISAEHIGVYNRVHYVLVKATYPDGKTEYFIMKIATNGYIIKTIKIEKHIMSEICNRIE